jgi:4-alpha-glucanotransferase
VYFAQHFVSLELILLHRSSGVLMHLTSLPSPCGIGTMGKEAYRFADFLHQAGQRYWQILPLGPTGFGDSPYQSFSSFAGNPYLIDLDLLAEEGLLLPEEYRSLDWGDDPSLVDFEKIYHNRFQVLRLAYERGYLSHQDALGQFIKEHSVWLFDYALFMALKEHFQGACWQDWPLEIRLRKPSAMRRYHDELRDQVNFYMFLQYLFYRQWTELRRYVNELGISIIGDIPLYVALDSADAWANPKVFWLDEDGRPVCVAGCPPDYFSPTGQLWGNPLYDWEYLRHTGYKWWLGRLSGALRFYDVVRIDHFRGFEAYYSIPYGSATAEHGEWRKGPDFSFFRAVKRRLGSNLSVIAEDLGLITPEVRALLEKTGFPGMKVLEFAFDSDESNPYLPHNYTRNCVAYVGTHDNDTLRGWAATCGPWILQNATDYLNLTEKEGLNFGMIRGVMSSVADLAIVQMQDYLDLDTSARMNAPSQVGGNWQWRMLPDAIPADLAPRIRAMTQRYGRL